MMAPRRLCVGYMLADPDLDLSRNEDGRAQVERVVRLLRDLGHDLRFVAVQPEGVVLTDTGFGLQQFFEAARGSSGPNGAPDASPLVSEAVREFVREHRFPPRALEASDLAFCAGRRVFRSADLVHTRLSAVDVGGVLCARALRIPLVVEVHSLPREEEGPLPSHPSNGDSPSLSRVAARSTLGEARAVVTVSPSLRDRLIAEWAVPPGIITVLPAACETIEPASPDRIGYAGRLTGVYESVLG